MLSAHPGDLVAIYKIASLILLTVAASLGFAAGLFLPLCALLGPEVAARPRSGDADAPEDKDRLVGVVEMREPRRVWSSGTSTHGEG